MENENKRFEGRPAAAFVIVLATLGGILVLLFVVYAPRPLEVSDIRLRNETGFALQAVLVNGVPYGDVAAGGVTGYRGLPGACRYPALQLTMAGRRIDLIPDDCFGGQPLGKGRFTYRLRLADDGDETFVDISAVRDAE